MSALIVTALYFANRSDNSISSDAQEKALEIFRSQTKQSDQRTISSSYDYSLTYNPDSIDATGIVRSDATTDQTFSGETFTGEDLKTKRAYIMVELTPKKALAIDNESKDASMPKIPTSTPTARFYTNKSANFFDRSALPEDLRSLSDLELLLTAKKNQYKDNGFVLSSSDLTIDTVKYKFLKAKKDLKVGEEIISTTYQYELMTSQNGRPYWFTIINIRDSNAEQVSQLEQILRSVTFTSPKVSRTHQSGVRTAASLTAPLGINNTHGVVDDTTLITVAARNQIATVRIGAARCGNLVYRAQNGATLTLNDACSGGIGSGSIISGDGYVATNGHVADSVSEQSLFEGGLQKSDGWKKYYDFIVQAGYMTSAELLELINQARAGNNESLIKLVELIQLVPKQNISVEQEEKKYVVQTSNDPMRLDTTATRWGWKYTPTNIEAKLIDSEVNKSTGALDINAKESDVAILKAAGTFPNVSMATASVKTGDQLTAIGYPGSVDGGVDTKLERTVPTVSQGYISTIKQAGGNHKLLVTTAEIASGNSGGPAFDKNGKQIGLNTYGGASCSGGDENDNSCFGRGIARDIQDLKDMMNKNNIIAKDSELTTLWNKGMSEFLAGYYSKASTTFAALKTKYPSNYLVENFATVAEKQPADQPSSTNDKEFSQEYSYSNDGAILLDDQEGVSQSVTLFIILGLGGIIIVLGGSGVILYFVLRKPRITPTQPPAPQYSTQVQPTPLPPPVPNPYEAIPPPAVPTSDTDNNHRE